MLTNIYKNLLGEILADLNGWCKFYTSVKVVWKLSSVSKSLEKMDIVWYIF